MPFPPEKKSALAPRVPVARKIPTSPEAAMGLENLGDFRSPGGGRSSFSPVESRDYCGLPASSREITLMLLGLHD